LSISLPLRTLSIDAIESSSHIADWLSQFQLCDQSVAKTMLHRLRFVSREVYSSWLKQTLGNLPVGRSYALYGVRKLPEEGALWASDGTVANRPGGTLGSEDFVYSLIANVVRSSGGALKDHPTISDLRENKIHDYVLIDDSIGSGKRMTDFINAMLSHPTFLSWWSYGFVRFHILSFARPSDVERKIVAKVRGSDHPVRKFRKSEKIDFFSEQVYDAARIEQRWGSKADEILDLCQRTTRIKTKRRLGFGGVMANIVFHHSVPNNLPGVFWCDSAKWDGLFPNRALPDWTSELLDGSEGIRNLRCGLAPEIVNLLRLVKRGIRNTNHLAIRLGVDNTYAVELVKTAQHLNLISSEVRLTREGLKRFHGAANRNTLSRWNRTLYIPKSWCAAS
jgi:hypothetical protein